MLTLVLESYLWLNGKYYAMEDIGWCYDNQGKTAIKKNVTALMEIYELFGITDPPKDPSTGELLSPQTIMNEILNQEIDISTYCVNDM